MRNPEMLDQSGLSGWYLPSTSAEKIRLKRIRACLEAVFQPATFVVGLEINFVSESAGALDSLFKGTQETCTAQEARQAEGNVPMWLLVMTESFERSKNTQLKSVSTVRMSKRAGVQDV